MQTGEGDGRATRGRGVPAGLHAEGPGHPAGRRARGAGLRRWPPRRRSAASGSRRTTTQILGVPKNADAAAIKKAYRKLAQQHHPDANAGNTQAEERFKEISAAYDVLGDPEKRAAYDRAREMGAAGFGGGFPGGRRAGPGRRFRRCARRSTSRTCSAACSVAAAAARAAGTRSHRGADLETAVSLLVRRRDGGRDDPGHAHRPRRLLGLQRGRARRRGRNRSPARTAGASGSAW